MERKIINRKHFSFWSLKNWTFSVLSPLACFQCADKLYQRNMPKACPYVMVRFLFVLSDKLISEDWFFAEGERFLSFWQCHRPRKRAALGVWGG